MSEYLIQDITLTNIANPLRALGETTGTKTPVQMATIVTNANTTIATQGTLLDEVIEALEGKISPPMPSLPNADDYRFGYVPVMPVKGDLITMNLGAPTPFMGITDTYRVLSVNGTVAEVVGMFEANFTQFNPDSGSDVYGDSMLDTYLNVTWYGGLSATAKSAIVDKNVVQYSYAYGSATATHVSDADYSTKAIYTTPGARHVYALDVEDIEKYFGGTDNTPGTFSKVDIWTMFWNIQEQPEREYEYMLPWLRSIRPYRNYAYQLNEGGGNISLAPISYTTGCVARPAFCIDLSKIPFTPYSA